MTRSVTEAQIKSKTTKQGEKKKETKTTKEIPKDFIAHIVKLGYESKDDWLGMSVGGKVL